MPEDEVDGMSEDEFCNLLEFGLEEAGKEEDLGDIRVHSFERAGLLTKDKGIVVTIKGCEFQVTVFRSK